MPVAGTVGVQVPGIDAAGMSVSGAPSGAMDLEICEEALVACGFAKGPNGVYAQGAVSSTAMER